MQATPTQRTGKGGFFASLREALRGTEMDFTSGPLGRGILLLAVPMMLEMLGEALFALTDAFFVARLGPAALATVGMTESLLEVVYAIAVGLGMATTALVARRVGEKDRRGAAATAVQALGVAACLGCLLALLGVLAAPRLLRLMGADAATVAAGSGYTRWVYAGIPWVVLLFVGNAVFRGAGDASKAMRALWVANLINMLLDPCLIFGLGPFPRLGLEGAAVATNIGRATGVLYLFSRLARAGPHLALTRTDLRLQPQVVRRLLRLSVGGVGQFLIATASYIGLVRVLSTFGGATLAGYVVAIRIVIFVIMPSWGLSSAAATLVGQNLGARNPERAARAVWLTGVYNMILMGTITLVFLFLSRRIVTLFTQDPAVLPTAAAALRIVSYGYVFYAWGMVMTNAFNGAGDTTTPSWINLVAFWLFQLPVAWLLSRTLGLGPHGVFWAIALAYSLSAVIGVAVFRRGLWRRRQV
ncbi:MAG TPA: MATE family efflux transporter [Candidatus Krumholzibacteria bacterium]|nr:MATE family efflux transporter [Candidatus Krumholzibacteria bacterium]